MAREHAVHVLAQALHQRQHHAAQDHAHSSNRLPMGCTLALAHTPPSAFGVGACSSTKCCASSASGLSLSQSTPYVQNKVDS